MAFQKVSSHQDGTTDYHHPTGTHHNVYWATALAVYATANMEPEPFLTVISR